MPFAIAAGHDLTLQSAKVILENGGNAFDAAISATFSMFITEPCMASAGAGGFAMVAEKGQNMKMLDFFAHTPRKKNMQQSLDFYPIRVNFGNEWEEFHLGKASIAAPGMIKGLYEIHRRLGSIPMKELLAPAMELAKQGVLIDEFQEIDLSLLGPILWEEPAMRSVFFDEAGNTLKKGGFLKIPQVYEFLDMLSYEGEEEFYKGEICRVISDNFREGGGFLSREDLEQYEVFWRKPIQLQYKNHTIYLPNAPSMGGAINGLLFHHQQDQQDWVKTIIEARSSYGLLKNTYSAFAQKLPSAGLQVLDGSPYTKGTSHISIVDNDQNAIALSTSLGEGSGYFIPGTGMQMNNMLGEVFLLPDGFHSWQVNTRLHSMMTPTIVQGPKGLVVSGSGGAGRIPYVVAQVLDRYLADGISLMEATEAPRIYEMNKTLHFEAGAEIKHIPSDFQSKQWDYKSLFFGGVHSVRSGLDGAYDAAGDSRRYGHHFVSQ